MNVTIDNRFVESDIDASMFKLTNLLIPNFKKILAGSAGILNGA